MLPAIIALSLHNGGILAYLTARNVNLMQLPFDSSSNRLNRYFYEVLPRCYGQFLAFLFYRWEVIMRESAILGILGIYTLGHFIDSAISDDQLDKALVLIIITALLNMVIDTLSQKIRRSLQLSAHFVARSSS
jgi:phosphonate transport system permease protein